MRRGGILHCTGPPRVLPLIGDSSLLKGRWEIKWYLSQDIKASRTTCQLQSSTPKYLHRWVLALYHTRGPYKRLIFALNTSPRTNCIIISLQNKLQGHTVTGLSWQKTPSELGFEPTSSPGPYLLGKAAQKDKLCFHVLAKKDFLCGFFSHNDLPLSHYCFPWKQKCILQFPLDCLFFFLRIIAPKIKDFLLFIQVYMVLSDKCRMKGKSSLTTTLLNNLDLWIPAPLRADLTQEPRNLGLVLRQGGCWTSSVSGGSQAFQAAFLLFFLMLRKYFLNITSKMDSMLSPGH